MTQMPGKTGISRLESVKEDQDKLKYYGGCDVGSTFTKAVILDETGKKVADTTLRSKIDSRASATLAIAGAVENLNRAAEHTRVGYLTNNASRTDETVAGQLRSGAAGARDAAAAGCHGGV